MHPPPPPPQESSTMVPKYTLGCSKYNLTCSPDSHWDALELQPFAQGYPLAFTRALTERRSLMHYLNDLYINGGGDGEEGGGGGGVHGGSSGLSHYLT